MSVLEISRIDRETQTYTLATLFPNLTGPFTVASVALVPPRTGPSAATVWTTVAVTSASVAPLFAGPDADSTGAVVVTGNCDVWIKTVVGSQTATAKAGSIRLDGGGSITPLPSVYVASVAGLTGSPTAQSLVDALSTPLGAAFGAFAAPARATVQAQGVVTSSAVSALQSATPPPFAPVTAVGADDVLVRTHDVRQVVQGFGAALTDSAAYCFLTYLTPAQRQAALQDLYGDSGWSTVRISFGTSDFRQMAGYTYDDMPAGQSDPNLTQFDASMDGARIIPLLKQIQAIKPGLRIIAALWGGPAWMRTTNAFRSDRFQAYADYIVKAIQYYASMGLPIWAVTPSNEPVVSGTFTAADEGTFINNYLGPAMVAAGLSTEIWALDDSWPNASFAQTVLSAAANYVKGIAWHSYSGDPTAIASVQAPAHHMTEMRSMLAQGWGASLDSTGKTGILGALRHGASSGTLWNMALDQTGNPATTATGRRGVLTIPNDSSGQIVYSAEYFMLKHLGRATKAGSRVIGTSCPSKNVTPVGFLNPDGTVSVVLYNTTDAPVTLQIVDGDQGQGFPVTLPARGLATYTWGTTAYNSPAGVSVPLTAPAAPTLTAATSPGTVSLSWTVPASAMAVTGYQLARDGAPFLLLPPTRTSYTDFTTGAHTYTVQAISGAGAGAVSTAQSVTAPAATVPGTPVISATGSASGVQIQWAPVAPNGSPVQSYTVSRGTSSGSESWLTNAAKGSTSYLDTTAVAGTDYYYTVVATNSMGVSAASNEVKGRAGVGFASAVEKDATTATTSVTWTHTIGSDTNNALVVAVASNASLTGPSTTVTVNGVSMTRLGQAFGGTNVRSVVLFGLSGVAPGTAMIALTSSSSAAFACSSMAFTGVNQATPFGTVAGVVQAATTLGLTMTGTANGMLAAAACVRSTTQPTTDVGTIQTTGGATSNALSDAVTLAATGSAQTINWTIPTADTIALVGVPINAA